MLIHLQKKDLLPVIEILKLKYFNIHCLGLMHFSKNLIILACANLDKVYTEKIWIVYKFKISQLTNNDEISKYHCNDVCSIIVCTFQFSISGNYKHDSDGGIIEFDIPSGKKIGAKIEFNNAQYIVNK